MARPLARARRWSTASGSGIRISSCPRGPSSISFSTAPPRPRRSRRRKSRRSESRRKASVCIRELLLDVRHDLLAVKASVLDEDFVGVPAGNHDSGKVETGHIALQGLRVAGGTVALGINFDPGVPQQIDVRMVARQRKDKVILQANRLALPVLNANPVLGNLLHFG